MLSVPFMVRRESSVASRVAVLASVAPSVTVSFASPDIRRVPLFLNSVPSESVSAAEPYICTFPSLMIFAPFVTVRADVSRKMSVPFAGISRSAVSSTDALFCNATVTPLTSRLSNAAISSAPVMLSAQYSTFTMAEAMPVISSESVLPPAGQ